jgi:hypothetical protein
MKTQVKDTIKIERFAGTKYVRAIAPFPFYSVILGRWSEIPAGFIYDEESIPVLRGSSPEAGAIHDYLCRYNSDPVVDKITAAAVYREFIAYYSSIEPKQSNRFKEWLNAIYDYIKMRIKPDVVIVAPGYFHRLPVMATLEQVQGVV